jgi:riboflavin kinase/FMN adenylyltransferase
MPFIVAHSAEEWRGHFGGDSLPRTAVAIGNFDGVHLGHQAILRAVVQNARAQSALAAVVTFDPHPLRVLRPADAPPMLMPLAQRLRCFAELGLDAALVLKFDAAFSKLSPEEFVRRILVEALAVKAVLLGDNFRFGYRHAGDVKLLTELGRTGACGSTFDVAVVPPVFHRGTIVSSTLVRRALREGAVSRAARLLGRPYELEGIVQRGQGIGRKLVVPTLNLVTGAEILPAHGVYATETCAGTRAGGKWYRSVTNIGVRPTVNADALDAGAAAPVNVESNLFDFDADITEGPLAVRFCMRLRDERKFPGLDALRVQILRDAARAQRFFRRAHTRIAEAHQGNDSF